MDFYKHIPDSYLTSPISIPLLLSQNTSKLYTRLTNTYTRRYIAIAQPLNPFNIVPAHVADTTAGYDRSGVDQLFKTEYLQVSVRMCIICTNPAQYKLIPKHARLATAQLEDQGYICKHCVSQQYVSPEDYKLKELI